jgi:hypothetical protein
VSSSTKPEGVRYEIAIDGTPRTYRDWDNLARQAATLLKAAQPHSEITIRDLWTGKVTVIKHPSST